jgi:LacI family transcriptional regulator
MMVKEDSMGSLQDIAKEVGVSVATASLVLSNKADTVGIKEATRQRVWEAARKLRYRPNWLARGLSTGRTYTIGTLFYDTRELLYAELLSKIQTLLHPHGYAGLCAFWDNMSMAREVFGAVIDRGVDGLITSHHDVTIIPEHIPLVLMFVTDERHDSVWRDNTAAYRLAAEHLLELGHRRLGVVCAPASTTKSDLTALLRSRGGDIQYYCHDEPLRDLVADSIRCMDKIFNQPPEKRPTGLICRNDTVAMIAMSEAGRRGFNVPRDFSVIGSDAVSLGAIANPPLTSVGVEPLELARCAVDLMMRRLNEPDAPRRVVRMDMRLFERGSCAAPPTSRPR